MHRYVLSAGRTGTVFLTHKLSELGSVSAVHEPSPSRWQMMLANFRNDTGLGGLLLQKWFDATRSRRNDITVPQVVLNPFLCPMADLIPMEGVASHVVHLVRHPENWAVSMTIFKASTRFRHFIDFIPFSKPYPAPRPKDWHKLPEVEKALWRWRWCNERVLDISAVVTRFQTIRSEDLFGNNLQISAEAAQKFFDTLALPGQLPSGFANATEHRNEKPAGNVEVPSGAVKRICGPLATKFGYEV